MTSTTAPVAATEFRAVGAGQTNNDTVVLCSIDLQANERAAIFEAYAASDQGGAAVARAVGFMVPEVGWRLEGDAEFALSAPLVVTFSVSGVPANWIGAVEIAFTQDYSPE